MSTRHAVALRFPAEQAFATSPFFDTIKIAIARFQLQGLYPRFNQITLDGVGLERLNKPPSQKPIYEFRSPAIASRGLPWLAFR